MALALFAACGGAEVAPVAGEPVAGAAGARGGGPSDRTSTGTSPEVLPSAPASSLEVLYEGEDDPAALALDERYLYWASLDVLQATCGST